MRWQHHRRFFPARRRCALPRESEWSRQEDGHLQKLFLAGLLLVVLTTATLALGATGTDSSIFVYTYGDEGAASAIAHFLEGEIGDGLRSKCIDWTSETNALTVVDWQKFGETIGKEEDQEMLQNLADATGSRYVMGIVSFSHPDGRISVAVQVYDRGTDKPTQIVYESEPPTNGKTALENSKSLANKIVQTLSPHFPNQCVEHWQGTISYSFKRENKSEKTGSEKVGSWPGQPQGAVNTSTYTTLDSDKDFVEVMLQPISLGSEGTDRPMARVVHKYEFQLSRKNKSTTWIKCGAFGVGQPNPMRQTEREESHLITKNGNASSKETVRILIDRNDGKYTIEVKYPPVTTKRHEEQSDTNPGNRCDPKPISSSSESREAPREATNFIKVSGQADPKNPDLLSGKDVTGDIEKGETMRTWNLRLIKPKPKESPF